MSDYNPMINIIAYETCELDDAGIVTLFSHLIKTGQAWTLQGHYGRMAEQLIDGGFISKDGEILVDANLMAEGDEDEE